jgi:hypothetical protein
MNLFCSPRRTWVEFGGEGGADFRISLAQRRSYTSLRALQLLAPVGRSEGGPNGRARRSTMNRWFCTLSVILLILAVVSSGCSEEVGGRGAVVVGTLDRKILKFQQGTPIAVVKSELGEPVTEIFKDDRVVLNYGPWQLISIDGHLTQRTKEHLLARGPVPAYTRASERRSKALDARILNLSLGMSIKEVKSKLGMPERYYEVFRSSPIPERKLWYESWELSFGVGKLIMRTKF